VTAPSHDPVLLEESLLFLRPERGGTYVDCTLGLGGHTEALVSRGATRVIGIDRDAEALAIARERLGPVAGRV
jgi:16S rRNA (cytosine1402-N4)-methyltransferase